MRRLLRILFTTCLAGSLVGVVPQISVAAAAPTARATHRPITYAQWDTGAQLRAGTLRGTRVRHGRLVLAKPSDKNSTRPSTRRHLAGTSYDVGRWTSPWVSPGFGLTQLVASWSATTPRNSWIEVKVRGRDATGHRSSWDTLGRWASGDRFLRRTSVRGQSDDLADVDVDTWKARDAAGLTTWKLRVSLMRRTGARSASPAVDTIGAMASRLPIVSSVPTSRPGPGRGVVLDVPRYSQMVHDGDYTQYGGGGEAWCSPTSTSMVLGYYDALPPASGRSWVPAGHVDPWVDQAARSTYDAAYSGTGNWPFNTAYAAPLAGHAFVTRLRSLREAERFVVAGIPVVASISFGRGQLSGAPISASNGHLVVIVGFTASGDVVVNDPAAPHRGGVRRTYDRGQFENAWLPRSGGLAYVITDDAHPLPTGRHSNW